MTELLDRAIEATRDLPADLQDELARIMMSFVQEGQDIHVLTPGEEASFAISLDQTRRREFATDEDASDRDQPASLSPVPPAR